MLNVLLFIKYTYRMHLDHGCWRFICITDYSDISADSHWYILKHIALHWLKLPSLFAARLFWTFHNKLHIMKALVILSHHDHHFSHLVVFMKKKKTFMCPCELFWSIFSRKTSLRSLFQHRGSYRHLCPNF